MKYSLPPFNEKEEREFFEEKILDFSKELFRNPKLGLSFVLFLNILFIYAYFKSKSILSIILYLFFVYLLLSLALGTFFDFKRNK